MTKLLKLLVDQGYFVSFVKDLSDIQVHMVKDGLGQYARIKFVNFDDCCGDLLVVMKNKIDVALKTRKP